MKGSIVDGVIQVVLSKRNLLTLLHKLDVPTSKREIVKQTGGVFISVRAEDDNTHYKDATPGKMSTDTEAFIKAHS